MTWYGMQWRRTISRHGHFDQRLLCVCMHASMHACICATIHLYAMHTKCATSWAYIHSCIHTSKSREKKRVKERNLFTTVCSNKQQQQKQQMHAVISFDLSLRAILQREATAAAQLLCMQWTFFCVVIHNRIISPLMIIIIRLFKKKKKQQ